MASTLATYYATIQDMPESEYKVEILEDGLIKRLAINGKVYEVDYNLGGDTLLSIIIGNKSHGVQITQLPSGSYEVQNRGELYQICLKGELDRLRNTQEVSSSGRQMIVTPMPGVILKVYVKKGDRVTKGDPLCVLVAMKMENEIRATTDGVVKDIFVTEEAKVAQNDKLMIIE